MRLLLLIQPSAHFIAKRVQWECALEGVMSLTKAAEHKGIAYSSVFTIIIDRVATPLKVLIDDLPCDA
jgi:hypothetical protein